MAGIAGLFKKPARTRVQPDTHTLWTTPWRWKDEEGLYIGHDNQQWLYRTLPMNPMEWEDPGTRLTYGNRLATLLATLGATSRVPLGSLRQLSDNREFHLISLTWDQLPTPPRDNPADLADYQRAALGFIVPERVLLVGVRLRVSTGPGEDTSMAKQATKLIAKVLAEDVPDRTAYEKDRELVTAILNRFGAQVMNRETARQLESWYNLGRGPDVTIVEQTSSLTVGNFSDLEMSAVMRFGRAVMQAPDDMWLMDALTHPDAPKTISIRGELEPAVVTRQRSRSSQRRVNAAMEEEAMTGDLERVEYSQTFQQARAFEEQLASSTEPILTNTSIVMAREITGEDESYIDYLRDTYEISVKPLEHRQLPALEETLPCSQARVNPFLQDLTISMLAFAGLNGFASLGDSSGARAFTGLAEPDGVPVWLEFLGAPRQNKPAAMLVGGDSGSGKTHFMQNLATQGTLADLTVIFINPKGYDSLSPFAELVGGSVIKMSALEDVPGAFDPFRYAPPRIAAEIAATHILSVLEGGWTQEQRLELADGLKRGAIAGAGCVGQALTYVDDPAVVRQVRQQAQASAVFALGIAETPQQSFTDVSGLTLIEFDRKLDLPAKNKTAAEYTTAEHIALAALRLVTRASLEILAARGGGMLLMDEAWTFLGHPVGRAALDQLGREGRSLNILPVFATQRIADLLDADMEGYLSRVFVLQLTEEREAAAALRLIGLEPTPERIAWLRTCGPRRGENGQPGQMPRALHRDLLGRHSAVLLGPIPPEALVAFSTNPEDRRAREEALRAQEPSPAGAGELGPDPA